MNEMDPVTTDAEPSRGGRATQHLSAPFVKVSQWINHLRQTSVPTHQTADAVVHKQQETLHDTFRREKKRAIHSYLWRFLECGGARGNRNDNNTFHASSFYKASSCLCTARSHGESHRWVSERLLKIEKEMEKGKHYRLHDVRKHSWKHLFMFSIRYGRWFSYFSSHYL